MESCLFCKIINKEIPTEFVYQDSEVSVFKDLHPKARVHLLVVPAKHVGTFLDLQSENFSLLTKMVKVIQSLIKSQKIEGAYRITINGGTHQEVPHLHWHLLGD